MRGYTVDDKKWMERAVQLGKESKREGNDKPYVGVVIAKDGELLGESYRGETGTGRHAEFGLIETLQSNGIDLSGATVYSTLEPCSTRNHPKVPCAQHLAEAGISKVFIGIYDPNPHIYRAGWKKLDGSGVSLRDFPEYLRNEIKADNKQFIDQYEKAFGPTGCATFDWTQRDGTFTIINGDEVHDFKIGGCGDESVYVYSTNGNTCLMKGAYEFDKIDDPGAFSWGSHATKLEVGEIVAVRYPTGYLLIKGTEVMSENRGAACSKFSFEFDLRARKENGGLTGCTFS